ncbi:glycosyltransferase [soil metagenome]
MSAGSVPPGGRRPRIGAASLLRMARSLYLTLPISQGTKLRLVDLTYRLTGPLLSGTPHYRNWAKSRESGAGVTSVRLAAISADIDQALATLAFDASEAPVVSIVIPTYGKLAMTLACLHAVRSTTRHLACEVIVVEDASGDSAMQCLAGVPGLVWSSNETNLGFVGTSNAGAARARGEWLVFLNNDTEPQAGWLDALLQAFETRPDAGLVGSKLIYPDGRQQECGAIVWRDATAWNVGRLDDPKFSEYCFLRQVDYCSGASLMVRRSLFERVGRFDERYAPGYYEDASLAFAVRAAGHTTWVQPCSVVVHHEGASAGLNLSNGMKAAQIRNRATFAQQWKAAIRQQPVYGTPVRQAGERLADRSVVLVVDQYVLRPDRDAGARSVWDMMTTLQSQGWTVKFWPNTLWYEPEYTQRMQRLGIEVFYAPRYSNRFAQVVDELGAALHAVVLNRPFIARDYLRQLGRRRHLRTVFYGHDIHHQRLLMQREADLPDAPTLREIEAVRSVETALWAQCDVTLYPSSAEVQHVRSAAPAAQVFQLPLYAFDSFPSPPPLTQRTRDRLLFVAGFGHPPNVDAVHWFVRDILPSIRAVRPSVTLSIVGSNPPPDVVELGRLPGVETTGAVSAEALDARYRESHVAIVPLRFGGGVKGKVVEALRYGLPTVTTSVGAQGIAGIESALTVTDRPADFAQAVLNLLTDDVQWLATSQRMQALAESAFSRAALAGVLEQAIGAPAAAAVAGAAIVDAA